MHRTITLHTARRVFIQRQRLNDPTADNNAAGILDVVRDLGCLQLDPISAVARSTSWCYGAGWATMI
jgi:uncharacterized protein YcaQ